MRVLIAAGGTAGHINPALAIAGALKKADPTAEIHFAGRKEGMEYRLVTQAGYPFHHIEITGFQRKLSLHNIKRNIVTLWNLALSGPKAKAIMKEVQPDLVIGCGGPPLWKSWEHPIRPSWWETRCARRCLQRQRSGMPSVPSLAQATAPWCFPSAAVWAHAASMR